MQKWSKGIKNVLLKIVLLTIFSLYTCSITFFTHTHIIGGVTIVHSHFYGTDEEGKPTHEHTGAEIQLIQYLSTYYIFGAIALTILIGLVTNGSITLYINRDCSFTRLLHQTLLRLRAPPVYSFTS